VFAIDAREAAVAQKTELNDPEALRAIEAKTIDEVIARIDGWLSKHR
jgi:hypothetical protein